MSDSSNPAERYWSATAASVVLVHGAWHGSWCWEQLTPILDQAGVPHDEVELPLTGHDDDVQMVTAALDAIRGPKILVGHSYGGLVISGAAQGRHDVNHLVYVCAFMLDEGSRVLDVLGHLPLSRLFEALTTTTDGRSAITPEGAPAAFYNTSPAELAAEASARLRPMESKSTNHRCTGAPWRSVDSTYVVCDRDQAIPPEGQRSMATGRATSIVTLDVDHSPFLSAPVDLANIVLRCVL